MSVFASCRGQFGEGTCAESRNVFIFCITAAFALATFVFSQTKVKYPLLPMRIVLDRNRGGAYISVLVNGIALFGSFFFLTYYLQTILNYSPVKTGLAFLPMTACVIINANVARPAKTRISDTTENNATGRRLPCTSPRLRAVIPQI